MRLIQILIYVIVLTVLLPILTIYIMDGPNSGQWSTSQTIEQQLANRLIELSDRIKHAEMLSRDRKRDINSLKSYINSLRETIKWNLIHNNFNNINAINNSYIKKEFNESNFVDLVNSLKLKGRDSRSSLLFSDVLQLPSIYHFLPHLLSSMDSLKPSFRLSKSSRNSVTMVFGVPTVKREIESYLVSTLHNLIDNLSNEERLEACIVVFIAETDLDYVMKTAAEIETQFSEHIDSGLLEIISPPLKYYPNLTTIRQTLGDPLERVRWRSKQNLDFAYLMMYSQPKGTYYVQLEDDILTKPSYLTKMKRFATKSSIQYKDWLILDFCVLGFIGKMFKSVDLSMLIIFFVIFHNDKPVDWLLEHLIQTKLCRFDRDLKDCKKQKDLVWLHHKPSLFQHIGTHSSLKGKVQKLRDRGFGKLSLYYSHKDNPRAEVFSTLKHYKGHSIERAYLGDTFFWGMTPKLGDNITFTFTPPIFLERYFIRSSNPEHPEDKLINATVEVLPLSKKPPTSPLYLDTTSDGYFIIGGFKIMKGMANGFVPQLLSPIKQLRIRITADSDHWVIINEIYIKTYKEANEDISNNLLALR